MKLVYKLMYRRPYEYTPELLCICDSEESAQDKIDRLMYIHPDAFPERSRFEIYPIEFYAVEGVVTN